MIKREEYLSRLRNLRDTNLIKVVTGIRRAGKSTLFRQFQDELLASGVPAKNILYLNLEELENAPLLNAYLLHDYIMKNVDRKQKNYVFLDEIQLVSEFERLVDSLHVKDFIDIYITGSNAYFLSSDLATLLTGRYIEMKIMPFSFKEFVAGYNVDTGAAFGKSKSDIFNDYMTIGGFPEALNLLNAGRRSEISKYISSVYQTILEKDIMKRNKIRSKFDFENLVRFMMDSVGSMVSPNNIANTMTSFGNKINKETVDNYLSQLTASFILYYAQRYDIKGKKLLQTLGKFYVVDVALTAALLGRETNINRGHLLENMVYLELLRRYKTVFIGKAGEKEVDFVAVDDQGYTHYYQVALTMREESVREREIAAFDTVRDHNPKYILSLDPEEPVYSGIICRNVIDWLLD